MPGHAKAPSTVSDINVTPLVDVMLVLLIIFMVITPMLQKNISVDLAQSHNPRAMPDDDKEDAVEVAITRDGKIYLKKNIPSAAVFDFGIAARSRGGAQPIPEIAVPPNHRPMVSMQQLADRKAIEKYAPPGVLLNENLEVIQFRGNTGPYLAPAPGTATFNIFKLARPELFAELRVAIQRASDEGLPVTSDALRLWDDRESQVSIDVLPLQDAVAIAGQQFALCGQQHRAHRHFAAQGA